VNKKKIGLNFGWALAGFYVVLPSQDIGVSTWVPLPFH